MTTEKQPDLIDTIKDGTDQQVTAATVGVINEQFERDVADRQQRRAAEREAKRRDEIAARQSIIVPSLVAHTAKALPTVTFPPKQALLKRAGQPFLQTGQIMEVFATRGYGKTWLLMALALMLSAGKSALGFDVDRPIRVLYVDGEMAQQDIQERFARLAKLMKIPLTDRLVIIGADWQDDFLPRVDTPEGQAALEPFVRDADAVIFDNRSCLCDPEGETDTAAWQPMQEYLLSLRRRGKTSILAHHANRQGGARGLGRPEDIMNIVMKLAKPEDYSVEHGARFICDVSPPDGKIRGIYGAAAAPFELHLTDKGWIVKSLGDPSNLSDAELRKRILLTVEKETAAGNKLTSANAIFRQVKGARDNALRVVAEMLQKGELVQKRGQGIVIGNVQTPAPTTAVLDDLVIPEP